MIESMKLVMIVYNEAVEAEVQEVLAAQGIKNYTKIPVAYGQGATSGTHLGTDIWPGRNAIMHVACREEQARALLMSIRELRKVIGQEGVKAFLQPLEDMT